jgi:hypothetical protein
MKDLTYQANDLKFLYLVSLSKVDVDVCNNELRQFFAPFSLFAAAMCASFGTCGRGN